MLFPLQAEEGAMPIYENVAGLHSMQLHQEVAPATIYSVVQHPVSQTSRGFLLSTGPPLNR